MKIINKVITLMMAAEIETGKLPNKPMVPCCKNGGTMLLAAVTRKEANPIRILCLSVDYKEKFAAAGRYPGDL